MERNLERWPVFSLSTRPPRRIEVHDEDAYWVVTASEDRLPGPLAQDVYIAFCKLYNDARRPENREVTTTFSELCDVMHKVRSGPLYKAIRAALFEMKRMMITSVKTFREGEILATEKAFSLLDSVQFDHRRDGDTARTQVTVRFSEEVVDSLNRGYFRLLNVELYYRLSSPTAKRLYRYLDMRRWRGQEAQTQITLPLTELRDHLPILRHAPSDIRRPLEGADEELLREGYLRSVDYQQGEGQGAEAWSVTYWFQSNPFNQERGNDSYIRDTVTEILQLLEDPKSVGFYVQVVKALPESVLPRLLGTAREFKAQVGVEAARKMFTATAKSQAQQLGIEL